MHRLLLLLLLISPLSLLAQDAQTEALMEQMGYQKVDLEALNKKQLAQKNCATCPLRANTNQQAATPSINAAAEIETLNRQIPNLKQAIADLQNDPTADPAMLNKYQAALDYNNKKIKALEAALPQKEPQKKEPTIIK